MKKTATCIIGLFTTLFYACNSTQQSNSYSVEGMLKDSSFNGKTIYMVRYDDNKVVDSTIVNGNKFIFKGKVDTASFCNIHVEQGQSANFILEKGTIKIDLLSRNDNPSGTPMNDKITQIAAIEKGFNEAFSKKREALREKYKNNGAEYSKELIEAYENMNQMIADEAVELFKTHSNDAIGEYLLYTSYLPNDEAQLETTLNSLGEWLKSRNKVKELLTMIANKKNTAEGKPFVDIIGKNPEGNKVALSNYVGKGNYVLMDMWASWCGPCRGEIPNLRKLHEQFKDKGLVVLGVYVWDEEKNLKTAIEKEQITWPQIMDSEKNATQLYGVDGIPQIVLFSPDGTILHRNLRGDHMINTVTELLNKQ